MLPLMLLYAIGGCLLAALSVPLILGKIGPNPWYGFRVPKTLNNPAVWYPANAYTARRLCAVGLAGSAFAASMYFMPNIDLNSYAIVCGGAILAGLMLAVIQSFLYLRTLPSSS